MEDQVLQYAQEVLPLIVVLIGLVFLKNLERLRYHHKELQALKLGDNLKVKWDGEKKVLKFLKYNSTLSEENFVKYLPILSNIFGVSFIDITIKRRKLRQTEIHLHRENWIKQTYQHTKIKPRHCYLGKDQFGIPFTIDLERYFSIRFAASGGSGKSEALKVIIEDLNHSLNNNLQVLLVCAKPHEEDFAYLLNNSRVECLNPLKEEDLERCIEIFCQINEQFQSRKIEKKFKNYLLVFDEAGQYLKILKGDKGKLKEKKQKLIDLARKHCQLNRYTKIPIIFSSQGSKEDEIDIPKEYIKLIISGKQNSTVSLAFTGDAKFLVDHSLHAGKMAISTEYGNKKVQFRLLDSTKSKFLEDNHENNKTRT